MAAALVAVLLLSGCDWPRDAGSTLERVRGGVLRVGVTAHPPWTTVATPGPDGSVGAVGGAEVRLVERLAAEVGARIEWRAGTESELMGALRHRVLHLVIGGLTDTAPWTKEASLTWHYVTMRTIVAVPAGVASPATLAGARVAVRAGSAEVADLAGRDAVVVAVPEVTGAEGVPVVVEEWRVEPLGLRRTRHVLGEHKHVFAVPLGENGWQSTVERFLIELRHDEVVTLLRAEQRPSGAGS